MNIPFIKYTKWWLILSAVIVLLSVGVFAKWGLKAGIDFTGGSLMELTFSQDRPSVEEMGEIFASKQLPNSVIQRTDKNGFIIRTSFIGEETHQDILGNIRDKYQAEENTVREERFETVGPSVSESLKRNAWRAVFFVSLAIIIYVAYAFRKVSRPVASWKYGVLAIIALIHDLLLMIGVFSVLGHYFGVEIDVGFVVALLTVLGYSVNDTIVVYDRIRENLMRHSADNFPEVVNNGLNQTLLRSINTTGTTLLPLLALFFFGGSTIHNFVLALIIGITAGAYSSIFIASPLLVMVEKWQRRNA